MKNMAKAKKKCRLKKPTRCTKDFLVRMMKPLLDMYKKKRRYANEGWMDKALWAWRAGAEETRAHCTEEYIVKDFVFV